MWQIKLQIVFVFKIEFQTLAFQTKKNPKFRILNFENIFEIINLSPSKSLTRGNVGSSFPANNKQAK